MKVNIKHKKYGTNTEVIISSNDVWNLDSTLANIILPMLLQLRSESTGIPSEFVNRYGGDMDDNYCFDFIHEDQDRTFDLGVDKWHEALDKMIWAFHQIASDEYSDQYHHGVSSFSWEPSEITFYNPLTKQVEKTSKLVDKDPDGHWTDYDGMKIHEERIQEGIELFGKYYRSLWC